MVNETLCIPVNDGPVTINYDRLPFPLLLFMDFLLVVELLPAVVLSPVVPFMAARLAARSNLEEVLGGLRASLCEDAC